MCAILDNDVAGQVFGADRPEAGRAFFDWLDSGRGRLVAGGKLLKELDKTRAFETWRQQAVLAGRFRLVNALAVEEQTRKLKQKSSCRSNDAHVIALALVSGARLLYSNDRELGDDFRDKKLIENPPGKVYTTRRAKNAPPEFDNTKFRPRHRKMLDNSACGTRVADA